MQASDTDKKSSTSGNTGLSIPTKSLESPRFTAEHLAEMQREGLVLIPEFFSRAEVDEAAAQCRKLFQNVKENVCHCVNEQYLRNDGERIFPTESWFDYFGFPYKNSQALNLIGCHKEIVKAVRMILGSESVAMHYNYVSAKFAGFKNYSQPLHIDSPTHSFLPHSTNLGLSSVNCVIYLSNVDEGKGPLSYIPFSDEEIVKETDITLGFDENHRFSSREKTALGLTGTVVFYYHHLYHRGTNPSQLGAERYQLVAAYHAEEATGFVGGNPWPNRYSDAWGNFLSEASDEQLHLVGVPCRTHAYWRNVDIERVEALYPQWNVRAYLKV